MLDSLVILHFRLLDSSHKLVDDAVNVHFLESVSADKSLWCRLNLSFRQLMNYVLLSAAGQSINQFGTRITEYIESPYIIYLIVFYSTF